MNALWLRRNLGARIVVSTELSIVRFWPNAAAPTVLRNVRYRG
jgi:hypothetical protein